MNAKTANKLWLFTARRDRRRFLKDAAAPEERQAACLQQYLSQNKTTRFGLEHDFGRLSSADEYRRALPVRTRDDFAAYIDRIAAGESQVLTNDPVAFFEETSGTAQFASLIPYTVGLKQEFQRALNSWLRGLYERRPAAFAGPAYWSLSPAVREPRRTPGGVMIGAVNDSEYFSPLSAYLLKKILAVPESLNNETDPHTFYLQSLVHLFERPNLSLISVWSPTFFLRLDEFLRAHTPEVLELASNRIGRERLRRIESILQTDFCWRDLFPGLALMSCWTQAQSALWMHRVRERLGAVAIEGKGLLATEGVVSIPVDDGDPALAIGCHYYEFRDPTDGGVYLPGELKTGATYEPIITTGGGLYRYSPGDLVEVTGFFRRLPRLRFVGRLNRSCDLVGEKLSEYQVARALEQTLQNTLADQIAFAFLAPEKISGTPGYILYTIPVDEDARTKLNQSRTRQMELVQRVEAELERNPYYQQARALGQLQSLRTRVTSPDARQRLFDALRKHRRTLDGDIKLPVLYAIDPLNVQENHSPAEAVRDATL